MSVNNFGINTGSKVFVSSGRLRKSLESKTGEIVKFVSGSGKFCAKFKIFEKNDDGIEEPKEAAFMFSPTELTAI